MRAFSDTERMFPSFTSCYSHGVVVGEVARRGWPCFAGVDLSGPNRPGNAITVAALDPSSSRRYPIEIHVGAWKSPEVAAKLAEIDARLNLRVIMVENNGYQQSVIDWIRHSARQQSFWVKVESFTTGMNKANATYGLPSLEVEFKNQAWVVPADEFEGHPVDCQCGWCVWTADLRDYPMVPYGDCTMSAWFCREAMSRYFGLTGIQVSLPGGFNAR